MQHVGIDLGQRQSDICICDPTGKIVYRERIATPELERWLVKQPKSRFVFEACTQARAVMKIIRRVSNDNGQSHDPVVLPTHIARALGIGRRGIKTDRKDAETLALAAARNLELPHAYLRSASAMTLQSLVRTRGVLVTQRTQLRNAVGATLRADLRIKKPSRNSKNFEGKTRAIFEEFGLTIDMGTDVQLRMITTLDEEIAQLDERLDELGDSHDQVKRVRTIPCIGRVTSTLLVALIDDPHRFKSGDRVASYLGLIPGENSTGGRTQRTGVISAGPAMIRPLLVQCAWTLRKTRPGEPLVQWAARIEARRGKKVAVAALARKLAVIAWAMLRDDRNYDGSITVDRSRLESSAGAAVAEQLAKRNDSTK